MTKQEYTLYNDWIMARERLRELEKMSDPWLSERVGKDGHVVATDINTRFLDPLDHLNLEVWEHNLVTDEIPENRFDFAHARTF